MKSMPLMFGGQVVEVYGGPYFDRPSNMVGVKLAREISEPCDIDLPILDYSVPDPQQASKALQACFERMQKGESLYVGCWGGKGRTGLFMALMAKASGHPDPIGHARATYNPHAVETQEQADFVRDFPIRLLSKAYAQASAEAAQRSQNDQKIKAPKP
jgi:hypothetical protein